MPPLRCPRRGASIARATSRLLVHSGSTVAGSPDALPTWPDGPDQIRLSRAGMPRQQRVITWDQPSANYVIECPVPHGGAYRLIIPPEGEQSIRCPEGSDIVPHRLRGDPDAADYTAGAYAEATGHTPAASTARRAGTPAPSRRPGPRTRRASRPPGQRHGTAGRGEPSRAAPQDRNKRLRRQHPAPGPGS